MANPSSPHRDELVLASRLTALRLASPPKTPDEPKQVHFECEMCKKVFNAKKELSRHEKTHNKKITCRDCGQEFVTKEDLEDHKFSHEYFPQIMYQHFDILA